MGPTKPPDHRAEPTGLELDDQLCFALYAATNSITRAYRPLLQQLGLTYPQYLAMLVLWEGDDVPTHRIAERLDLPRNALSPLLDRLEAAGLVARRSGAADRREVRVRLTDAGRALRHPTVAVARTVARGIHLDPAQIAALRDDLHRLRTATSLPPPVGAVDHPHGPRGVDSDDS